MIVIITLVTSLSNSSSFKILRHNWRSKEKVASDQLKIISQSEFKMATDKALDKTFNRFSFICGQNVFGTFLAFAIIFLHPSKALIICLKRHQWKYVCSSILSPLIILIVIIIVILIVIIIVIIIVNVIVIVVVIVAIIMLLTRDLCDAQEKLKLQSKELKDALQQRKLAMSEYTEVDVIVIFRQRQRQCLNTSRLTSS